MKKEIEERATMIAQAKSEIPYVIAIPRGYVVNRRMNGKKRKDNDRVVLKWRW